MNGKAAEFRVFPKTWGAEFVRAGEVRFKLWAPAEERLILRLDGADTPMSRNQDGWFELLATGVAPDTTYGFVLADGTAVPDPAARAQAGDVNGPSVVVDPTAYRWQNQDWRGRPWEEAILYELHIGTFTAAGTFSAAMAKLEHLAGLGVTAVEFMPVAQFAGQRGWGYDSVLPYAPHNAYGTPDDLKALIDRAHELGLMVFLDVVYNHFGPEGNYLARYAPEFFHTERQTPWGAAIAYDKRPVRQFFVENALYWLEEYNLDGLRFDAIDQIRDETSDTEILVEIAQRVRAEFPDRHIHLTTEDNRNITRLHERAPDGRPRLYTGEWNDDFHNVVHVIATGEAEGYYADFAEDRWGKLARALAEGFVYQGEPSLHSNRKRRGEPSGVLPPVAFVDFLQNHDQVGNRAFGERLLALADEELVRAFTAILLLSPHIPLLFMGEEWGEQRPFCFFTDFRGELADAVREGRRREFAHFPAFQDPADLGRIPDPNDPATFEASKIDWSRAEAQPGAEWLRFVRSLLDLRRRHVVPLLRSAGSHAGRVITAGEELIAVDWRLNGAILELRANLGRWPRQVPAFHGHVLFAQASQAVDFIARSGELPGPAVLSALRGDRPGEEG
jgi:maltooligosyltrehalose trehalohydrolase